MKVPSNIVVAQAGMQFQLEYENGESYTMTAEFLRVHSPSAEVQGHRPEEAVLQVGKKDISIKNVEPVGLYAIKIIFSDGHDSGLYAWDYLYKIAQNQDQLWNRYLRQLQKVGASREPNDPSNIPFLPKKKTCGHQ